MYDDDTTLTVEQAIVLANDLVAHLGTMPGNADAVSDALARWAEELGPDRMAQVCMAAVQLTFAECLVRTRHEDWPTEGAALRTPQRTHS